MFAKREQAPLLVYGMTRHEREQLEKRILVTDTCPHQWNHPGVNSDGGVDSAGGDSRSIWFVAS